MKRFKQACWVLASYGFSNEKHHILIRRRISLDNCLNTSREWIGSSEADPESKEYTHPQFNINWLNTASDVPCRNWFMSIWCTSLRLQGCNLCFRRWSWNDYTHTHTHTVQHSQNMLMQFVVISSEIHVYIQRWYTLESTIVVTSLSTSQSHRMSKCRLVIGWIKKDCKNNFHMHFKTRCRSLTINTRDTSNTFSIMNFKH